MIPGGTLKNLKKASFIGQASLLAISSMMPTLVHAKSQQNNTIDTQNIPAEAAEEQSPEDSSEVVVTGSRIRRSQAEGPAPITVISTEQMRKNGFATVYEALRTTTEALGNVQSDSDWGQSSVNASPLNLRNLGPGRTLLLVNGHRVADYPMPYQGKSNFANFNNLPNGIIDRVEILTGAASAVYGSDAMGGVVNVVLKEKASGHTARLRYGGATRGGSRNWEGVLSGGFSGTDWNVVYNLQHFNRGTLLAKDRPFMDEEQDQGYTARGVAERHFNLGRVNPGTGVYVRDLDRTDTFAMAVAPPSGSCDRFGDLFYPAERLTYNRNTRVEGRNGGYCAQRAFRNWSLRTGSRDSSGYVHTNVDLGDVRFWSSIGLWHTVGGYNSFLNAFAQNYWDPNARNGAGNARRVVRRITPGESGGLDAVMTRSNETAVDISAGLRGTIFDQFDWDLMVGRATYRVRESFPVISQGKARQAFLGNRLGSYKHPSLGELGIFTPDYNRFWNPLTEAQADPFLDRGTKRARSSMDQAQLVVSGTVFDGWAGPIQLAASLEAGRQAYHLTPEPKTLLRDDDAWETPFGNIEQGGGSRNRYAAGLEVKVPLLKSLTATAAGRYDKYDAVASDAALTYQAGIEFRPAGNLLFRGSYGTAFRAPDMHFVYARPSSSIADFTDYSACYAAGFVGNRCNRDDFLIDDASVSRQGTSKLLYEKGKSLTAGAVWDAFRGFSVSVDYWRIAIDNLIDDVGAEQVLIDEGWCRYGKMPDATVRQPPLSEQLCALQTGRVVRNARGVVTGIQTGPINRAQTRVSGIDAKLSYQIRDTPIGNFTLGTNYTEMLEYRSRQFPGDKFQNSIAQQSPRARATATVNWTYDRWNASFFMHQKSGGRVNRWNGCTAFSDGFIPSAGTNCKDQDPASPTFGQSTSIVRKKRSPRRYFNASFGYQVTEWAKFNLYANNIFDKIYGDKYCGDFAFCIDDPVGRDVAAELVVTF